jgi:hypothetical protein
MGPIKRKRTPSGLIDIPYEESARADADGHRLYSMAQRLEITPVQAIVRFFTRGKGQCKIQSDFEGLIKILSLLPDCDWHQDPAIYTDGETKRRAVIRERGKPWMTTEILSQEDVTEQYLKPLLGETFNVAEFLQRLVEEGLTPEEGAKALQLAITQAKAQPLAAHRRPTAEEQEGKGDNVTITERGNGQTYLLRRIARDQPQLLDQIGPDKEFRSVRAAAIEAGIIKPVPTVRLVADMAVVAGKLCQHLTQQQRIQLIDLLAPDL